MTSYDSALALWGTFPVHASPRPIVLIDEPLLIDPSGFVDAEAKKAFIAGQITTAVTLPKGVADLLSRVGASPSKESVEVVAVSRVDTVFLTDRGLRQFGAYALETTGTIRPVTVLDPAISVWWQPTGLQTRVLDHEPATISADGLALEVPSFGGLTTEFIGCTCVETEQAVLVDPVARDATTEVTELMRVTRSVTASLRVPLENRVLVNSRGLPIPVMRGGEEAGRAERMGV